MTAQGINEDLVKKLEFMGIDIIRAEFSEDTIVGISELEE